MSACNPFKARINENTTTEEIQNTQDNKYDKSEKKQKEYKNMKRADALEAEDSIKEQSKDAIKDKIKDNKLSKQSVSKNNYKAKISKEKNKRSKDIIADKDIEYYNNLKNNIQQNPINNTNTNTNNKNINNISNETTHKTGKTKFIQGNTITHSTHSSNRKSENNNLDEQTNDNKSLEALYLIVDNEIISLSEYGKNELSKSKELIIPEGVTSIGENAFKGLELTKVKLPSTLKYIKKDAFYDNNLENIELPTSLIEIQRGAFDKNNLSEICLANPNCKIDGIFYNNQYVNILTTNPDIKDEIEKNTNISYKRNDLEDIKAYGSLVNRASIKVKYYDENENLEFEEVIVSKNKKNKFKRTDDDFSKYLKRNDKINVVALKNDYLHLGNVEINCDVINNIDFHYNNKAVPTEQIQKNSKKPIINGYKQALLISTDESFVNLKKDIFAIDSNMNNITDKVEILNEDEINTKKAGAYNIIYHVKDNSGNENTAVRKLFVEEKNVWYPHDFYYDGNVLLGLSDIGQLKLNTLLIFASDKKIDLPKKSVSGADIKIIASAAFSNLRIRNINIPNGYEIIRKKAFDSTLLESLTLPDSIIEVSDNAFSFTNIKDLKLSKNLKKIGERAFSGFIGSGIPSLDLGNKLEVISDSAFANTTIKSKALEIPSSVKEIGENAFENCKINKLILNEGLIEIKDAAFSKNNLQKLILPNTLTKLAPGAFKQNSDGAGSNYIKVALITKDGKNPHNFESNIFQEINPEAKPNTNIDDIVESDFEFQNQKLKLSRQGIEKFKTLKKAGKEIELLIPSTINDKIVTEIAATSFMSKNIKALKLPDSLEIIGESSFYNNKITELTLPETVRIVKNGAFYNNNISKLILKNNIEAIEQNAFYNNNLEKVNLPESIKLIGKDAFKKKSGKVKLIINYNDNTKAFIKANENRTDFILEALGKPEEPKTNEFTMTLKNKETKYGIKAGERIVFSLEPFTPNVELEINGTKVKPVVSSWSKNVILNDNIYKNLISSDNKLNLKFTIDKNTILEKEIKLFIPDEIKLKNPDLKFKKSDNISFELLSENYPIEDFKLYKDMNAFYNKKPISGVRINDNTVTINYDFSQAEESVTFLATAKYHKNTNITLNFEADNTSSANDITFITKDNSSDIYKYESSKISDNIYEKLKESFENNDIEMTAGRITYSKGSDIDISTDEYFIEFNDVAKNIILYLNKPQSFEDFKIFFADIELNYSFDGDNNIIKE